MTQPALERTDDAGQPVTTPVEGQSGTNGVHTSKETTAAWTRPGVAALPDQAPPSKELAVFSFESAESPVGRFAGRLGKALAERQVGVHLFCREAFPEVAGMVCHRLGDLPAGDFLSRVEEFGRRAATAFISRFPAGSNPTLLGLEWSTVPALQQIRASRDCQTLLSLTSVEHQRSDMQSDVSRCIVDIEHAGIQQAKAVLVHDDATKTIVQSLLPHCTERLQHAREAFPTHHFESQLDPGAVKGRHEIGPIDPTILFIGDLDHRHGADILMKSVPAVLKNHPQARFALVGCGDLYWPLRVHSRYLLLEHAVRLVGSLVDQPLFELIQAADVVVVPSREVTEWWPVQAAWAAGRPVVVGQPVAEAMGVQHERNGVVTYPHESSLVWGIERILYDAHLQDTLATEGKKELDERFGWNLVANQIMELMEVHSAK